MTVYSIVLSFIVTLKDSPCLRPRSALPRGDSSEMRGMSASTTPASTGETSCTAKSSLLELSSKVTTEPRSTCVRSWSSMMIIIEDHERTQVDLGSVVTLEDSSSKEDFAVQLVSPVEAGVVEADIPRISDESPLGKALLGRKQGESFKVTMKDKTMEYTVIAIR